MEGLEFRNGRVRLHELSSFPALRLFNPQSIITIRVCMFACVSVYMYNYYAVKDTAALTIYLTDMRFD